MMHAGRVHHHAQAESVGGHSLCNQFCEEFFKYMYSTSMMPNDPYIYIYRYRFIDRNKYLHTYLLYMYREFIALGWFLHKNRENHHALSQNMFIGYGFLDPHLVIWFNRWFPLCWYNLDHVGTSDWGTIPTGKLSGKHRWLGAPPKKTRL